VELETGAVRFGGPDTCPWGPFPDLDARDGPGRREVVVGRTGMCVPGDASFCKLNRCIIQITMSRFTLDRPTNAG
jgi:hypothetical protein